MAEGGDRDRAGRARLRWFAAGGGLAGLAIGVLAEPIGIPIALALAVAALLLGLAALLVARSAGP